MVVWRRLMNAYEVKAGMVCLQCKHCVIHARVLQRRVSYDGALYKSFYLLYTHGIYRKKRLVAEMTYGSSGTLNFAHYEANK